MKRLQDMQQRLKARVQPRPYSNDSPSQMSYILTRKVFGCRQYHAALINVNKHFIRTFKGLITYTLALIMRTSIQNVTHNLH